MEHALITTKEISKKSGKPHSDIIKKLREIKQELKFDFYNDLWNISSYVNKAGTRCLMYSVTKKGLLLLLANFDFQTQIALLDMIDSKEKELNKELKQQTILAERAWEKLDQLELYRRLWN